MNKSRAQKIYPLTTDRQLHTTLLSRDLRTHYFFVHFQDTSIHEDVASRVHFQDTSIREDVASRVHFQDTSIHEDVASRVHFQDTSIHEDVADGVHFQDTTIREDVANGDDDVGNDSDSSLGSGDTSLTSVSQPTVQAPRRDRISTGAKRKLSRPEAVMEQACTVLSQISASPRATPQPVIHEDDDDDIFGKHIAREMKKVQNERSKSLAKVRIQSILFEAQFDEPVPIPAPSGYFQVGTLSSNQIQMSCKDEPCEPSDREPG